MKWIKADEKPKSYQDKYFVPEIGEQVTFKDRAPYRGSVQKQLEGKVTGYGDGFVRVKIPWPGKDLESFHGPNIIFVSIDDPNYDPEFKVIN